KGEYAVASVFQFGIGQIGTWEEAVGSESLVLDGHVGRRLAQKIALQVRGEFVDVEPLVEEFANAAAGRAEGRLCAAVESPKRRVVAEADFVGPVVTKTDVRHKPGLAGLFESAIFAVRADFP